MRMCGDNKKADFYTDSYSSLSQGGSVSVQSSQTLRVCSVAVSWGMTRLHTDSELPPGVQPAAGPAGPAPLPPCRPRPPPSSPVPCAVYQAPSTAAGSHPWLDSGRPPVRPGGASSLGEGLLTVASGLLSMPPATLLRSAGIICAFSLL